MTVAMIEHADREAACAALATQVTQDLTHSLQHQDAAALVVSGGSSPAPLLKRLSQEHLAWSRVYVVPSDERVVPVTHPDSNAGMIKATMLHTQAAAARLVSLLPDALGNLQAVHQRLERLPLPFAHVVLGMGTDGHTASLFPCAADIATTLESTELVVGQTVPGQASERVSLTIRLLLNARAISLLVFGADKQKVLRKAMNPGAAAELPIRAILHQNQCPVQVYWAP